MADHNENLKDTLNEEIEHADQKPAEEHYSLNDDRRVKVLSPGMLVAKRFFRNRLAVTGMAILVFMFVFSFIGGLISPYEQDKFFYADKTIRREFAAVIKNTEFRYSSADDSVFGLPAQAQAMLAIQQQKDGFTYRDNRFTLTKEAAKEKLGVNDGRPLIVSFWGSLGASGMNAQMADMLALEAGKEPFHHIHGAGKSGYAAVLKALAEKGVDLKDHPSLQVREYIYDMAPVMRAADLVICRAGASTVSELTALGVPAIMVPSPYVTNNHQEKNARALETHGGVEVLLEQDSSGQALFQAAAGILRDDARREAMASAMAELGIRDAAQRIYETVQELL